MGIVDTMMVGRLPNSATAMGAVSLGSSIFIVLGLFGGGLLLGLDTLVSQAFGAGMREDCHRSLINGIYLSIALTPILAAPVWLLPRLLSSVQVNPAVLSQTIPYTKALVVGLFPLLLYFAVRRCLQAMNMVKPVAFALVTANLVNALGNWILIYGNWGAPAMGAVGSGWSTAIARTYMAAVLVGYLLWYDHRHRTELLNTPVDIDLPRIRRLIALGFPAAMQSTLESGVFAAVTTLIAKLGRRSVGEPSDCAQHGLTHLHGAAGNLVCRGGARRASAGPQRSCRSRRRRRHSDLSRRRLHDLRQHGPARFPSRNRAPVHARRRAVIHSTVGLLAAGAAFQLFDGIQTVATGALRGVGDTRTPMFCHFLAYWIIGLPLGAWLCFRLGWGAIGLWVGAQPGANSDRNRPVVASGAGLSEHYAPLTLEA